MNTITTKFKKTFNYKLIYVFRINDSAHENVLKIGDASVETEQNFIDLNPNSETLNSAAKKRIDSYTSTAGIVYELLHTEIAIDNKNRAFRDYRVHNVLLNSGVKNKYFDTYKKQDEWFFVDLKTAKNAILSVKEGKQSLTRNQITNDKNPIIFRPEQLEAIEKTIKQFRTSNRMLWNAKMRFGKTLTALQIVKNQGFKKTIIITHRPVVEKGWFEDFDKIFYDTNNYRVGAKDRENIKSLEKTGDKYVYFASIQDLRGSSFVGGNFDKNNEIFHIDWDFVIIDEAHEGTKTDLGKNVLNEIIKDNKEHITKVLHLSGTPFNLISDFEEKEIYTWDYVMEQSAKQDWTKNHFLDSNPYEELPKLNIFTYDLKDIIKGYQEIEDKAFNFREFFKTWSGDVEIDKKHLPPTANVGDFVHEDDVIKFLNLITKEDECSNFPYSTREYRELFRHTLWMVPGVKEAKALSKLMKKHPIFGSGAFEIVNVAGDGDEEVSNNNALSLVENAIGQKPDETYTITISCGKLTTGVSVKAWTGVLMLAGTYSTAASNYLQTIFRVQTPANIGGKIKENCYVFDFAPDRTLKIAAEAGNLSTRAGSLGDKKQMGAFLNFCPIISISGSEMKPYNVDNLLQQLKKVYADKVVNNGFDDVKIYNDNLLKLDGLELEKFKKLEEIMGTSKQTKKINEIDINKQGLTNEEFEEQQKLNAKPKHELTEEDKQRLAELKEKRKQKNTAISILRGISIRIPLMIYGANIPINDDITIENFTKIIDDNSWEEFMPRGITKEMFNDFSKYYDKDIFVEAGRRIRNKLRGAENLPITERVKRISEIFSTFRNPDKETVLTPWRVVNMHLGDCLGGYNFYDEEYINTLSEPRQIIYSGITANTLFNYNAKILEINSKTGLYPLYVAYSIYRQKYLNINKKIKVEEEKDVSEGLWEEVLNKNIFIICKTQMAKSITERTLRGFKNNNVNVIYYENLINDLKIKPNKFIETILNIKSWNIKEGDKMKFDAIVGNPPYQENISSEGDNSSLGKQLFPMFIINSIKLSSQYVSLISPSRWFAGDAQDKSFLKLREYIKENNHISKIYNYPNGQDVFDNVVIKGGVSYFLYEKDHAGEVEFFTYQDNKKTNNRRNLFEEGLDIILFNKDDFAILEKIKKDDFISLTTITKGRNAFGIVGKKDVVEKISKSDKYDGSIKLQCMNEEIRWTDKKNVTKSIDVFEKHKVFISKSAGDPSKDKKVIGKPYYAEPFKACTDSLIPVGKFDTMDEALSLQKYMKTKFLRFMVSILKVSQNVYQNVYQFVPLQDFTSNSDINWNKTIKEIDSQLYHKYLLSEEEIIYIENKIQEVE
jgi:hypothetical protein